MKLTILLLSLMLLSTPVWAECEKIDCECAWLSYDYHSCKAACEARKELCEIKEILKELVKK